jgi:DNA-binding transcriptional ArsR family regulator
MILHMKYFSYMVWAMKRNLTETCYGFFHTLANPTRLAIMEKLRTGPMNVTAIAEALNQEQSMISHNLQPLERCRLILPERKGKEKLFRLNSETMEPIFKAVENHAEKHCPAKGHCIHSK